jgi:8-oxo-dGTP pyrophosphatase MutT (NUDIX family)
MTTASSPQHPEPSTVDRAFRLAYRVAYKVMRTYWGLRRPTTHGALITLWNRGEVLLVRNSYVRYYSAPGGYVRRSESGREAAVRELREEVGVSASPESLELALEETHEWEGKHDHVEIFSLEVPQRPILRVDGREVVTADWFTPARALELDLFPPLRRVVQARLQATG